MLAAFEAVYRRLYGYVQPGGRIQVVNLRLAAIGTLPALSIQQAEAASGQPLPVATRPVWIDDQLGIQEVPVYHGVGLRPGQRVPGPAVVEELTTTILVGAGDRLTVTSADNYRIDLAAREDRA